MSHEDETIESCGFTWYRDKDAPDPYEDVETRDVEGWYLQDNPFPYEEDGFVYIAKDRHGIWRLRTSFLSEFPEVETEITRTSLEACISAFAAWWDKWKPVRLSDNLRIRKRWGGGAQLFDAKNSPLFELSQDELDNLAAALKSMVKE